MRYYPKENGRESIIGDFDSILVPSLKQFFKKINIKVRLLKKDENVKLVVSSIDNEILNECMRKFGGQVYETGGNKNSSNTTLPPPKNIPEKLKEKRNAPVKRVLENPEDYHVPSLNPLISLIH